MTKQIFPLGLRPEKPINVRGVALTDSELFRLDSHVESIGWKRARVMAAAIDTYLQLLDHYTANPQDTTNPLHVFFEAHLRLSQSEVKNDGTN